jgi:Bacterial regulatory protein, arsR family
VRGETAAGAMNVRSRNSRDDEIFERQARICKAFAHPGRLRILNLLGDRECGISELQKQLGFTKAAISQQISILKISGRSDHTAQWEADLLFSLDPGGQASLCVNTSGAEGPSR